MRDNKLFIYRIFTFILCITIIFIIACDDDDFVIERDSEGIWTADSAWKWWDNQPWLVGCNFIPSTAINQLEMWQEDTFDTETIDRELGWAADLGFNIVRVFLHDLLWQQDSEGFISRIDQYLTIADSHGIKTMFVLFDNVWGPNPKLGTQPDPIPGVHNSGWVQSPSMSDTIAFSDDESIQERLEEYVKGILTAFSNDDRVLIWDILNEPGNTAILNRCRPLLEATFQWAHEIKPSQPITAGTWNFELLNDLSEFQIAKSDIVSFHIYNEPEQVIALIEKIRLLTDRPLICTEYMARTVNSLFENNLPVFRDYDSGAINWGLVYGKTQTIYPWVFDYQGEEPEIWFHDIFYSDGKPYDEDEIVFIQDIIANNQ